MPAPSKPSGAKKIAADKEKSPRISPTMVVFDLGAQKDVEIPFIMGVMADLSGKPKEALPDVAKRKFLDIDSSNFDARLKAARPRVAFPVPVAKSLSPGGGNLMVDMEFESLDDFLPDRVAKKNKILAELLKHREALQNLASFLDGKADAEKALEEVMEKIRAMSKEAGK